MQTHTSTTRMKRLTGTSSAAVYVNEDAKIGEDGRAHYVNKVDVYFAHPQGRPSFWTKLTGSGNQKNKFAEGSMWSGLGISLLSFLFSSFKSQLSGPVLALGLLSFCIGEQAYLEQVSDEKSKAEREQRLIDITQNCFPEADITIYRANLPDSPCIYTKLGM